MSDLVMEARELHKSFTLGPVTIKVLKGLDLGVASGEMVAVVGASGVGKSTLLHILGSLDKPTSGEVLFKGESIIGIENSRLAGFRNRNIGFVFQFHHLLHEFTALENVMMPALISGETKEQAMKKATQILEAVGLGQRLTHKPTELSGGEQQRVAVARALVNQPSLLLADEPTGNLDIDTGASVHRLLIELNSRLGVAMVIATHNPELANICHRVLRLVNGKLEQTGR